MDNKDNKTEQFGGSGNPRIWSGVILLGCGVALLAYKMGAPIPSWLFTWPILLMLIGFIVAIKSQFRNPGGLIMIAIGTIFLIDQTNPKLNFHDYIVPAILISIGLIYILRPHHTWGGPGRRWRRRFYDRHNFKPTDIPFTPVKPATNGEPVGDEWLEINAVFGGVKKIILSKNFKGGEINCFMGGAELNMTQADLQQQVSLEVNNVFGGTKLIVPSNWDVKNEVTAVFGGIEDKRTIPVVAADPGKILVLRGTCVFGGIEIKNY